MNPGLHVTLVIPVFNEQERIAKTLYDVKDYLSHQAYTSDVIIINDGSNDLTSEVVRVVDIYSEELKSQSSVLLIENTENLGKGYSIAKGLLAAQGDIVVFIDADCSTPITEIENLICKIEEGYDVVVGSRNLKASVIEDRPFIRTVLSKGFNTIALALGLLSVTDSQCGFKAYRRSVARNLAAKQITYGYCFDVEHIYVASKLNYNVTEVPVSWKHNDGSTLSLLSDSVIMFIDLVKIRWVHRNLS